MSDVLDHGTSPVLKVNVEFKIKHKYDFEKWLLCLNLCFALGPEVEHPRPSWQSGGRLRPEGALPSAPARSPKAGALLSVRSRGLATEGKGGRGAAPQVATGPGAWLWEGSEPASRSTAPRPSRRQPFAEAAAEKGWSASEAKFFISPNFTTNRRKNNFT